RRTPGATAYRWFDAADGEWRDLTWRDMDVRARAWQVALTAEGLEAGDRVAIMLSNGPDWVCFDLAALGLGLIVVPLFFNDRPDNVAYILEQTQSRLLFMEGEAEWRMHEAALRPFAQLRIVLRNGAIEGDP